MYMKDRKRNISLDTESALALMQEIYNDIVENRNTASLIMKKMLSFMKDAEDMSTIGPVIKEQQKILNDCTEKKISLVKLQGALLKQSSGGGKEGFSNIFSKSGNKYTINNKNVLTRDFGSYNGLSHTP